MTGYPTPYICGSASSSRPNPRPRTAGLAHSGLPFHKASHQSSTLYSTLLNASPSSPAITASTTTRR